MKKWTWPPAARTFRDVSRSLGRTVGGFPTSAYSENSSLTARSY
jgi:hypothetical protein